MACFPTLLELFDSFVFVTLLLLVSGTLAAVEPSPETTATAAEQLKQLNDQTIIQSRMKRLDGRWEACGDGALATGKIGLYDLKCRSLMSEVTKHRATPT